MEERWNEIRQLWQNWKSLYVISGFLLGLMFYPLIQIMRHDVTELLTGLVPEAIGIGFTVLLIDRIYRIREEQRETRELHRRLLREAGSRDNSTAVSAIDTLRNENLLTGSNGLLKKSNLYRANLSGANFGEGANLSEAHLVGAQFEGTQLYQANLEHSVARQANFVETYMREANLSHADFTFSVMQLANLKEANLQGAQMNYVDLRGARIWGSNLSSCQLNGADLRGANLYPCDLRGANLEAANLALADLRDVQFDESTVMPDGTYWSTTIDLEKYTNPEHSDYQYYELRDTILKNLGSI